MIEYATFTRRLVAFFLALAIDLIVLGALEAITHGGDVWPAFAFWYLLHHVGFVTEGGNLGHRLVGLRVVSTTGERVRVVHAFARGLALVAVSLPPLGMGVLWMLDQPERRTWHDIIAGTVVVRELAPAATPSPAWADDPPWRRAKAPKEEFVPAPVPAHDAPPGPAPE